jgi:predicted Zn-dependent peptidase
MIQQTVIDGVPVLFSPRPGPLSAGLVFRVGQADEILPNRGITHLVEHLALHHHGLSDYHYNGSTGQAYTDFSMSGSDSDVVAYLNGVCDTLLNLPLDRLEIEKEILRTEEAGRGRSSGEELALWRYGARGYGLVGYPELGVAQLRPEDVRYWADNWFVAGNAALIS